MSLRAVRVRRRAVAAAVLASALALPALPATAGGSHHHGDEPAAPARVASGLDNPRQLTVTRDGVVYVAEAGRGGDGPCIEGPEGQACFGESGAVTRITRWGGQRQVVTGLPSLAGTDGSSATGPSDVAALDRGKLAVLVGLGADPAVRDTLPDGDRLGTLQLAREGKHRTRTIADLAAHEADENPIHEADSNPVGLLKSGSKFRVADAGGNTLVSASWWGRTRTTAVFQDQLVDAPPFLGLPAGTQIPSQAVPTDVVRGRDGALYVSQLTGFPFPAGKSSIYRVVPGEDPTVYATGLTNVTSLAVDRKGQLYAVQIADDGLLAVPEGTLPSGSLVRVAADGTRTVVADDLVAPYGVAIKGDRAYVSTCAVCAGGGEVWTYPLTGSTGGGGGVGG